MSITLIANQYTMSAVVYGIRIEVASATLEGVKQEFEHQLYLLDVSLESKGEAA